MVEFFFSYRRGAEDAEECCWIKMKMKMKMKIKMRGV